MKKYMRPGIFVATPAYGGWLSHGFFISSICLEKTCQKLGIEVQYQVVANESLITRARNVLVKQFLDSGLSHLLFLDADIEYEPDDIVRMYQANKPVIGGLYPKKKLQTEYVVIPYDHIPIQGDQPVSVRYIGTGMMMIQEDVIRKMSQNSPTFWAEGQTYPCLFDTRIYNGIYLSEDYHFCQTWLEMGGEIFAAPWTRAIHWGTYGYTARATS
jgi:glycosyltransferase involved in cell wall biosynthesis